MSNKGKFILIFFLCTGILVTLTLISFIELNNKESSLIAIILSLFSIISSYIVSQHFSENHHKLAISEVKELHKENLKTYAINAAEKVENLSQELRRFSVYLEEELDTNPENTEFDLISKKEKLNSAIHIINTLKNVNDTYLSDWRGIIPDELEEADEEKEEKEEELKYLIKSTQEFLSQQSGIEESKNDGNIREEIDNLKREIIHATRNLNNVRIRTIKPKKQDVKLNCPNCSTEISYQQKPVKNSFKPIVCKNCNKQSTGRWYENVGFVLEKNILIDESIKCPYCSEDFTDEMDTAMYSSKDTMCNICGAKIRLKRNINGLKASKISPPNGETTNNINEKELLDLVKEKLPEQPWPKDIHKTISNELGVSKSKVWSAINLLVRKGDFLPQYDGKISYPKEEQNQDISNK